MIITVLPTKRPNFYDKIIEFLSHQTVKPDLAVFSVPEFQFANSEHLSEWLDKAGIHTLVLREPPKTELSGIYREAFDTVGRIVNDGFMMLMSDDCWYEPKFIEETRDMFLLHPEAAIMGKTKFHVRFIGMNRQEYDECHGIIQPDGTTTWVQGDTMALNIKTYNENDHWRCNRSGIMADTELGEWALAHKLPIYSTSVDNFYYQRYPASHGHIWTPDRYSKDCGWK
jgi:hypothetical protein